MSALPLPRRAPPNLLSNPLLFSSIPSHRPTTTTSPSSTPTALLHPPHTRAATFIPRRKRPYAFTQLVQLSDGATFTARTTSPHALYKSQKDARNSLTWQPSEASLRGVEADEAGKLAAFRLRFGRGFDLGESKPATAAEGRGGGGGPGAKKAIGTAEEGKEEAERQEGDGMDMLGDLLSGYAAAAGMVSGKGLSAKEVRKLEKEKKKKK